jgi:hypothetical protein
MNTRNAAMMRRRNITPLNRQTLRWRSIVCQAPPTMSTPSGLPNQHFSEWATLSPFVYSDRVTLNGSYSATAHVFEKNAFAIDCLQSLYLRIVGSMRRSRN